MQHLPRLIALLCTIVILTAATLSPSVPEQVLRIDDRSVINFRQMVKEVGSSRLIFIAENHDDARHHAAQLELIRQLRQEGHQLAIGLEMFTTGSQKELDRWVAGKLSVARFRKIYLDDWNMSWEFYRDIFIYARDNRIPLIGLNLPKEISSKVARQGFAALSPEERLKLPPGITCNVSPGYMALLRQAYHDHGLSEKAFAHFCEAQVLWNRHMAMRMQEFRSRAPGKTLVALVGIGHALKSGAPGEMTDDARLYRVILPEIAGLNRHNLTVQDADYLLLFDDQAN